MSEKDTEQPEKDAERSEKAGWGGFLFPAGVVIGLWLFTLASFTFLSNYIPIDVGDRGTFGDMFGGVNALFTGLAFAGVVYTMILQRKELASQREELRLTRKTLERQKDEMEEQNKTLTVQRFEGSFYALMGILDQTVSGLEEEVRSGGNIYASHKGRDLIRHCLTRMLKSCDEIPENQLREHFSKMFAQEALLLGHYIPVVQAILLMIEESKIENGYRYHQILAATLAPQEKALIYYVCELDCYVNMEFPNLVRDSCILQTLHEQELYDEAHGRKGSIFSGLDSYKAR